MAAQGGSPPFAEFGAEQSNRLMRCVENQRLMSETVSNIKWR
jgi:hypothetical protein